MTHWGWYWKVKKRHRPKDLCSWYRALELDSFNMYKNKIGLSWVRNSKDQVLFEIPQYKLKAMLLADDSLRIVYNGGSYVIQVEKKPCNYGSFYRFFHCPACKARMRKLYCIEAVYLCRKCARLGYYSQRLRPSERNRYMTTKVEDSLKNRAGSLERKPPWVRKLTFQKLRIKYVKYDEKHFNETSKELYYLYGYKGDSYPMICDMYDAYVERAETEEMF